MRRNEHAPTPVLEPGSNTVKVRVVEMDDFAIEHYSAWSSLTFTLEPDVDAFTQESGATVGGTISGLGMLEGYTVQIDTDGDGTADTSTTTDMMGAWSIDLSSYLSSGTHTIYARTPNGEWVPLTFTF